MYPVPKKCLTLYGPSWYASATGIADFLIQIFGTSLVLVRIRASPAMVSVCDLAHQKCDEEKPKHAGLVQQNWAILRWLVNGHSNGCAPVEKSVIYLWSKVVCFVLFCLYQWDALNWDASNRVLHVVGKLWRRRRRGVSARFHGVWTCCAKVLEYWMIFFTQNLIKS